MKTRYSKRALTFILAFVMLASLFSFNAYAAAPYNVGLANDLDGGTLTYNIVPGGSLRLSVVPCDASDIPSSFASIDDVYSVHWSTLNFSTGLSRSNTSYSTNSVAVLAENDYANNGYAAAMKISVDAGAPTGSYQVIAYTGDKINPTTYAYFTINVVQPSGATPIALSADDYVFSKTTTNSGVRNVAFLAVPVDSSYAALGFDTQAEAAAVSVETISGSVSEPSYTIRPVDSVNVTGKYAAEVEFALDGTMTSLGPISEKVYTSTGLYTNFTIVVNDPNSIDPSGMYVAYISCRFYNNTVTGSNLLASSTQTLLRANAAADGKSYVTGFDGLMDSSVTSNVDYGSDITNPYVKSITINSTPYTAGAWPSMVGWQYRVYRNNTLVPISEYLGIGDVKLQSNDVVIWLYADFANPAAVFPLTLS
jgi:hypothetical protein